MKVLMLHDVRPYDDSFFPDRYRQHSFITDIEFKNGLEEIKKKLISFDAKNFTSNGAYSFHNNDKFILTFDDGLKDHIWVAEMLAEKNIKAAFFIPFGVIHEKCFIHSHLIQFLNASGKRDLIALELFEFLSDKINLTIEEINQFKISKWKNNSWSKDEIFITRALREVFNYDTRDRLLEYFFKKYIKRDLLEIHDKFYLSLDEVRQISLMGHIIGSHGYLSLDLRYEIPSTIHSEVSNSFEYLQSFPNFLKSISYPNGGFSASIRHSVMSAGFEIGFGTVHRQLEMGDDILHLPRLDGTKLGIFK